MFTLTQYKLLTPGPLTVTDRVRQAMDFDYCTWDEDYKAVTQDIRHKLLHLAQVDPDRYTTILLQGSGSYAVEACLSTFSRPDTKFLILSNGKYGERMLQMADYQKLDYEAYKVAYDEVHDPQVVACLLDKNPDISHVMMVHSETTSGILNPIADIAQVAKAHDCFFFVDAMSSFGGVPIDMGPIDALITSANKCIQGVPGFAIVLVRKDLIEASKGNSSTLSLDLFDQYQEMARDGKWRYTSPTHVVMAFHEALKEFEERGGVAAQHARYQKNQELLQEGMESLGFKAYVPREYQGPIITTFLYPEGQSWDFQDMYHYIKERGYVIYPGKLTDVDTFRIGNIGEIYPEDIARLLDIFKAYMEEKHNDRH